MKIATFGGRAIFCQVNRIDDGFTMLGHELTGVNPDLIYCNDSVYYNEAIELKNKFPIAKLILNILDIPEHLEKNVVNKELFKIKPLLEKADKITCISEFVQSQIIKFLSLESSVIYNPIQDLTLSGNYSEKTNHFLYVGRANDPNKRFDLVMESAIKLRASIRIVGTENPLGINKTGFCGNTKVEYLGVVDIATLQKEYESSKYCILPGRIEGLCLGAPEAIICGCVPILASDNLTAYEFFPIEFICDPNIESIVNKIISFEQDYKSVINNNINLRIELFNKLNKIQIAQNIINVYNQFNS